MLTFDLEPRLAATAHVSRIDALGYDPFEAELACGLQYAGPIGVEELLRRTRFCSRPSNNVSRSARRALNSICRKSLPFRYSTSNTK